MDQVDNPIHQVQAGTVSSRKWWRSVLGCCVAGQMREIEAKGDVRECIQAIKGMRPEYQGSPILPPPRPQHQGKKTLVIDLDETLVHSSFTPVPSPDYVIPVEIDARIVDVYVRKRPWVDHFLEAVASKFEVVVFTASLTKYADPLLTEMDRYQAIHHRLYRESCVFHEGNFVKDLSRLGRRLEDVIIIDNSPHSYIFQPENAIPIGTFIDDPHDRQLIDVLPYVLALHEVQDVRRALGMAFESILLHGADAHE